MLIPLPNLIRKYKIHPKGVLHVGASKGQEADAYFKAGIEHTIWIEPIEEIYHDLVNHVNKFPFKTKKSFNVLISDKENEIVDFHIANNEGQSSSMLEFGTHTKMHPTVKFERSVKKLPLRLDTLIENADIKLQHFDFLNVDVQGAELKVLKSLGIHLNIFKYAYIEVNIKELYKGCPLIHEIDEYLAGHGFERVETQITNWGWGDAFYIQK